MKKRIILLCFLLTIIISIAANTQTITFERSYPNFGINELIGLKTLELPGGGYLYAASQLSYIYVNGSNIRQWTNVILIKTDQNGYTLWRKEIETLPTEYRKTNQILITEQNEILLITVQSADSLNALNLKKFDLSGNETFNSNLIIDSSIVGCAITKTESDGYLVAYIGNGISPPVNIIKTDFQLNIIWQKKIYAATPTMTVGDFFLKKWGADGIAVGYRNQILKINSQGDSILVANRIHNFTSELNDGSLLLSGTKSLIKLDSMNNVIWTRNFLRDPGPVIQTSDGNYLININSYPDSLIKIDETGNVLWKKPVYGEAYHIIENSDNSILSSGILYAYFNIVDYGYKYIRNPWLLKTDSFGNYNSINLITPIGGENVLTFNGLIIGWHSNGVERINLFYSIDDRNNWNLIAENIDADSGQYKWSVPLLYTDSIKINIEDANNPNIFNYSEYPIYVSIYQPTDHISTNEIFMWIGNDGMGSHDPRTDASGFFWPGGDSATIAAIFNDGLVWGGKVNGEIRVNGNTYRAGLQPGKILEDGTADNPLSTQSKIFKIRKDWQSLTEGILKERLEYDYNHWPIEAGAPWDDVNEDGVYTPGFDKPKFIGDETLFYVANDLDTATSRFAYGSDPIGLEFQTTVFGFNREDLKDVVFKKYRVINKSNSDIEDMYFTYWTDDDMGYAGDDYEGFDSTYNMGYSFNGDNNDEGYYGTPPPAVGHMIVQGPIIPSLYGDSARYDKGWKRGYRNLKMASSGMNLKGQIFYPTDPDLGVYEGTVQFYNMMQGLNMDGSSIINPITGEPTLWPLSGDPVSGIGWYEGEGWPGGDSPGDHRFHVPSGPFNLAAGDTQEIVIAIPIARGTDNINSITKLRELAAHVQEFYNTELVEILNTKETIAPTGYTLFQNYPNPFNPKTTIEYEVPEKSNVTIKIYDILGREVKTLVDNEEKIRWKYKVEFDATNIASGVYFYRMQVNPVSGAGGFTETKKMVVLK
ncbi:MAG: T9SS type A sorting domain-containing protein [Ignavibacteriales bacterium]|nr:T9SS type A sorting domain-containing protein [Ignavibacteriales bacterium]